MTANYGMTKVSIEKKTHSGVVSWIVYADSDRFGQHAMMAQYAGLEEAEKWCMDNGAPEWTRPATEAEDLFREQVSAPGGKVQIGNLMFHRLRCEGGQCFGHSGGWEYNLTQAMRLCVMTGNRTGRTFFASSPRNKTVRFGRDCTW